MGGRLTFRHHKPAVAVLVEHAALAAYPYLVAAEHDAVYGGVAAVGGMADGEDRAVRPGDGLYECVPAVLTGLDCDVGFAHGDSIAQMEIEQGEYWNAERCGAKVVEGPGV